MKMMTFPRRKISFETFLCGIPARDYIYQDTAYEQQIRDAVILLRNAVSLTGKKGTRIYKA